MYPKLWEASGLAYPELVERLLDLAVERHAAERTKATAIAAAPAAPAVPTPTGGRRDR
jgi:D-alanine-D-alanine ligase